MYRLDSVWLARMTLRPLLLAERMALLLVVPLLL
jgi:hypothetical protein